MDSDVSSTSPLPIAKRRCLVLRPDTPDATCHGRIVQHSAQQHAASCRHGTQAGHLPYQAMLHQHQDGQTQGGHIPDVAAYLHRLHQLRRTAAIHANEAIMSQRQQQQQQQPPQSFLAEDRDTLHQQRREQAMPAQRQVAPVAAAQLQDAFHNATRSHTAASVPFKPQESNTAAPQSGHDLFDSFIHQLLGIQTPPQHQEQLPAAKLHHHSACTDALTGHSMHWQAHVPRVPMAQTHLQQPQLECQHHLQDVHRPVLRQPAELQQPLKAQPQHQMLHHVLNMTQHIAAQHLEAQQQAAQQTHKQLALMQRQAMLQQCLNIKQHAAVVEQQQQQRPVGSPSLGFPDLLLYLAKGLALQRTETVLLACHLWKKVQPQVSIAYMHLLGAGRPWESMLVGCLWVAAKLEECRRGVPTATKVGRLVQLDKAVMGGIELYLMQLVNWAPLRGWQISCV